MATQTLAAADAILKDYYVGPIVEQLNKKTFLLDQIERDSEHVDFTGRRAVVPLHTNRNRGRGSRGDGGTLPGAGVQSYLDAIIHMRYHYSGIEVTDAAIKSSQSNEGAFVSILDSESKGCAEDLRKDLNRQAFGTGDGLLATVAAEAKATKTIEVDSIQYLYVGDPVSIIVKSSGETGEGVAETTITKRIGSEKKVEVANEVTKVGTTYGFYLVGSRNNESDGLRNIAGTKSRTLHEVNSETAGNEFWNPRVIEVGTSASATATAGETSFEELAEQTALSGQGEAEVFLTSYGIRRRLADTYQSQKRFNDTQAVDVHGGYSAIMVNEIPVIADADCPRTWAFGLNKESYRWYELSSPGWMEQGGGGIFHLKNGTTAGTKVASWQAFFSWYAALGCVAPARNGALKFCADATPTGEGEV